MKNLVIFLCIFAYATATPGFIPSGPGFPGGSTPGFIPSGPGFPGGSAYPGIYGSRPAMYPRVNGGPYGISPVVAGSGAAFSPMVTGGPAVSLRPVVGSGPLYASGGDIGTGVPGIYSSGAAAPSFIEAPSVYSTGSSPGITYSGGARLAYSGSPGALSGYSYDRSGSVLYTPGSSAYSAYTGPAVSGTIGSAPVAYDLSGSARTAGLTYAPTSTTYGSFLDSRPAAYPAQLAYPGASTLRVAGAEGTGMVGGRAVYVGQATTGLTGVEYPGAIYQSSAPAFNTNPASAGAGVAVHRETSGGIIRGTDISSGGTIVTAQQSGTVSAGTLNGV